jgi:hypothetical protein
MICSMLASSFERSRISEVVEACSVWLGSRRERDALPLGDLDGATLAVIGFGRIGRARGRVGPRVRDARARA